MNWAAVFASSAIVTWHLAYWLPHLPKSKQLFQGKCFHNWQESENAFQEFVESWSMDFHATGITNLFLVVWMLSFKPTFSLSVFIFIERLFSSSSLSAIKVVSSAYLRLLIFLLAILIPVCASSSPAFLMMCSAYKLNKQGDNIQPWHTPFPIWN